MHSRRYCEESVSLSVACTTRMVRLSELHSHAVAAPVHICLSFQFRVWWSTLNSSVRSIQPRRRDSFRDGASWSRSQLIILEYNVTRSCLKSMC